MKALHTNSNNEAHEGVTLVVLTYNHSNFVKQAALAALSQDYPDLQIVFSDDGSTDDTVKIIKEVVDDYDGPHRVRIVENTRNLGVAAHVLARCNEVRTGIVVLAAGDDISRAERVRETVCAFSDPSFMAVCSLIDLIDEEGNTIRASGKRPAFVAEPEIFIKKRRLGTRVVQGCSSAYRTSLFPLPLDEGRKPYPEDLLLSFWIHCNRGRIQRIEKSLVAYRQHAGTISNRPLLEIFNSDLDDHDLDQARAHAQMFADFEKLAQTQNAEDLVDWKQLERAKMFSAEKLRWSESGILARLASLLVSIARGQGVEIRWKVLRLLGRHRRYLVMRLVHFSLERIAR